MTLVVSSLSVAVGSTGRRVVALRLAEGMVVVAHVGVLALRVQRSIDGASERSWSGIAADTWWWGHLIICVRASDDDLKAVPPLTFVGRLCGRNWRTPESTFVICQTGRIGAIDCVRILSRIAFAIHIVGLTAGGLIAKRGASECIIAFQRSEAHVIRGTQRCITVLHDHGVTIRGSGIVSQRCIFRV